MSNSTRFLTLPAMQHIDSFLVKAERFIDFSGTEKGVSNGVTAGTTIDIMKVPQGCVPIAAGFANVAHQDTVTFALSLESTTGGSIALLSATASTADNEVEIGFPTACGMVPDTAGGTIRVAVAAANAATAKINFFVIFMKLAQLS